MAFEFVARNGILSLSDITGSAGLQLTGLSADNTATTGLFKDGNDAVVTRTFGGLAFSSSIDISINTNLVGGSNLTLNGDTMNLDTNISLTSVTASFQGNLDGNATSASKADEIATKKKDTGTADHYLTFVDSNNTAATKESVFTNTNIKIKPSTGALTANSFTGSISNTDVDGLGNSATQNTGSMTVLSSSYAATASYAENAGLSITTKDDTADYAIVFYDSSGDALATDGTESHLTYSPFSNRLNISGSIRFGEPTGVKYTSLSWNDNQIALELDGTFLIPDYIKHKGDANTFIGFPANDTIGLTTANVERLTILSGGNVGIGNTSPSQALTVEGAISSSGKLYIGTVDNNTTSETTALVLYGKQVQSRELGTGAFVNVGNSATQDTGSMTVLSADSASKVEVTIQNTDDNNYFFTTARGANFETLYGHQGIAYNPSTGVLKTSDTIDYPLRIEAASFTGSFQGNVDGTAATASAVNITDTGDPNSAGNYRVTMVDDTGTTGETLYVKSNGLLFNPSTKKLIAYGDIQSGGNGSFTGDLTVGGTLTAQEFRTEYLTQVVIAQSGSTKLGNTPDDIHEVTGSLLVSENISLGSQLFVSASSISSAGSSTTDVAVVPYGSGYTVTAVHFDYKLYNSADTWFRTGTVMAVGKQGGSISYTDTSTNEPSSNNVTFECVDGGTDGIKLVVDNQSGVSIDLDVHIRRF